MIYYINMNLIDIIRPLRFKFDFDKHNTFIEFIEVCNSRLEIYICYLFVQVFIVFIFRKKEIISFI